MAEEKKFSHITLTSDEDDDIVIEAGLRSEPEVGEPEGVASDAEAFADAISEEAEEESVGFTDDTLLEEEYESSQESERTEHPTKQKSGGYIETTLEDLKGASMPFVQKVVIACALVFLIVAVLYYFLFMR